MGTAKGENERRDERSETDVQRSGTRRAKRRGRGRRRSSCSPHDSGEVELAPAPSQEVSGEHGVTVSFIETVSDHPVADLPVAADVSANSNHRADIVVAADVARAPAEGSPAATFAPAEPEPEPASDVAAVQASASVLDAPYSLRPSAPPKGASVWPMRVWVTVMCSIIAAAGWVALREQQRKAASTAPSSPQAPAAAASAPAQTESEADEKERGEPSAEPVQGASVLQPVQPEHADPPLDEAVAAPEEQAPRSDPKASAEPTEEQVDAPDPVEPKRERAHRAPLSASPRAEGSERADEPAGATPQASAEEPAEGPRQDLPSLPLPQNPYDTDVVANSSP